MITPKERNILRELAKRQAEISALPEMAEREKLWYDLNDGKPGHPLVTMEFHGLEHEVYSPPRCEDSFARSLELQMERQLFKYETFKDDRVIPASVSVVIPNWLSLFGYTHSIRRAKGNDGASGMGYMYDHVVQDLEADFSVFKPSAFEADAGLTEAKRMKAIAEEILGDILRVRLECAPLWFCPGNALIEMMSMETMFCSILDYPGLFHQLMRRLTDDYLAFMDAMEASGALLPTNDATGIPMDTYCYTHDLPGANELNRPVRMSDLWGYTNFQETVGMSVPMFDEFFFSYTKEIAARCGLYSYGCCEPVHTLWEPCLSKLPNLRKVSISPWCDEAYMGDAIRGKRIVYHRKPFPNFIAVDDVFDEAAFLRHMEKTMKAARGCPLEVTFRDICSTRGETWRLARAVELTRVAFDRWYV